MKTFLFVFVFISIPFLLNAQTFKTLEFTAKSENAYVLSEDDEKIDFLVKIKANKAKKKFKRTPLNISLVIDRSGSMEGKKLEYVKKACNLVIDNLEKEDYLSVVIYDSDVMVLVNSSPVNNKDLLRQRINSISSRGATNLSGGMLEGFAQVKSNYDTKKVNRVLLLSDGLANEGVTSVEELQRIVKSKFKEDGIALSTFGVGADFNEDLMTNIAEFGKGNYYFIDSPDNIPTIFQKELDGLLTVVAQNAKLRVNYPNYYLSLDKTYGYESKTTVGKTYIDFNDIVSGEDQIVLIRFSKKKKIKKDISFKFNLQYDDVLNNYKRISEDINLNIKYTENIGLYKNSFNKEVVKYKLLFLSNEQFSIAASMADHGDYKGAHKLISTKLKNLRLGLEKHGITPDEYLAEQIKSQEDYLVILKGMKDMNRLDRNMMQKSQKSSNNVYYKNKTK
jgi:Ca-activated chloride channel homolog